MYLKELSLMSTSKMPTSTVSSTNSPNIAKIGNLDISQLLLKVYFLIKIKREVKLFQLKKTLPTKFGPGLTSMRGCS